MTQHRAQRPVLLLGWIPRIVTTIARRLSDNGVPVDVVSFSTKVRSHSVAIRRSFRLPNPCLDSRICVAQLRELIVENGYDMLIPTDDQGLALLSDHYDSFRELLHVACPPAGILASVLKKTNTLDIASRCGIRVPVGCVVRSVKELEETLTRIRLPAVVKPLAKSVREEAFKSCVVRSQEEARTLLDIGPWLEPPLLIQEFCEGSGVGVEVLLWEGKARAVFQHRRLKEFPYNGGFSVLAVAEKPDPGLVQSSIALLQALNWNGVAMVEYKVNPSSGGATLLEVNGRYWGSLGLPIAAGMDFPLYHWRLVHGKNPEVATTYRVGTRWRWTAGYIARLHELMALAVRSSEGRHALRSALYDLPRDFSPSVCDSAFQWRDPAPSLAELALAAKHFLAYDAKAVLRRIRKGSCHRETTFRMVNG